MEDVEQGISDSGETNGQSDSSWSKDTYRETFDKSSSTQSDIISKNDHIDEDIAGMRLAGKLAGTREMTVEDVMSANRGMDREQAEYRLANLRLSGDDRVNLGSDKRTETNAKTDRSAISSQVIEGEKVENQQAEPENIAIDQKQGLFGRIRNRFRSETHAPTTQELHDREQSAVAKTSIDSEVADMKAMNAKTDQYNRDQDTLTAIKREHPDYTDDQIQDALAMRKLHNPISQVAKQDDLSFLDNLDDLGTVGNPVLDSDAVVSESADTETSDESPNYNDTRMGEDTQFGENEDNGEQYMEQELQRKVEMLTREPHLNYTFPFIDRIVSINYDQRSGRYIQNEYHTDGTKPTRKVFDNKDDAINEMRKLEKRLTDDDAVDYSNYNYQEQTEESSAA